MNISRTSMIALAVAMLFFLGFSFVNAVPTAPETFTPGLTTTFNDGNYVEQSHAASAGNITALVIFAVGQTKAWQGYYGNITGRITLDDANNFTFYNWTSTEPQGEIYATLSTTPTWDRIECYNFSAVGGGAGNGINETDIERFYNIDTDDPDGVAETYSLTNHPAFEVGPLQLTGCPTTYIFQSDAAQTANFVNVLLHDTTDNTSGWVYTTIIENKTANSTNDLLCYNGQPCDFQILVNEDGHGTDIATTTYYFWVEMQ